MADATNPEGFRDECPYCDREVECDLVDVGVGYVQAGPFHCEDCGATQVGPYDRDKSRRDPRTDWYPPGAPAGSTTNMIGGRVVSAAEAKAAYHARFAGSPDYHVPGLVEAWWREQRGEVPDGAEAPPLPPLAPKAQARWEERERWRRQWEAERAAAAIDPCD